MRAVPLLAVVALLATVALVAQPSADAAGPDRVGIAFDGGQIEGNLFNQLASDGAAHADDLYKLKIFEAFNVDKRGNPVDEFTVVNKLARKSDLVIAAAFYYADAVDAVASTNAGTNFAVIDNFPTEPNAVGLTFAHNEGSFLVGAAAAMKSDSTTFGFIGGMDIPVIEEFRAGFEAGVLYIDPTAEVVTEYVGDFNDPVRASEIALGMYESGIDVVYPAAGGSTIGAAWAAEAYSAILGNAHVWMIGVDFDYYPFVDPSFQPHVLTSMVKNVDLAVFETIESQVTGTFAGGAELFDLSRNGVDYTTSGGYIDAHVPDLEIIRAGIIAGTIFVP